MKYGEIDSLVKGIDSVVFDYTVTGSAVSSIDTGNILNGDEDGVYTLICFFKSGANSNLLKIRPNGDNSNIYGYKGIGAISTSVSDNSYSPSPSLSFVQDVGSTDTNEYSFGIHTIYAKTGAVRLCNTICANGISGTTVDNLMCGSQVWNDTSTNITSFVFSLNSGDIQVGSRIIIIKGNGFTDGIKTGVINTSGIKNAWIRHDSQTLASPASSVSFTGLDGDKDVLYWVKQTSKNAHNGANYIGIRINGDTGNNVGYQYLLASNTTVSGARATSGNSEFILGGTNAINLYSQAECLIFAPKGFIRPAITQSVRSINGTTVGDVLYAGNSWNNTADNITELTVVASGGNLAAGSTFELYKLNI